MHFFSELTLGQDLWVQNGMFIMSAVRLMKLDTGPPAGVKQKIQENWLHLKCILNVEANSIFFYEVFMGFLLFWAGNFTLKSLESYAFSRTIKACHM